MNTRRIDQTTSRAADWLLRLREDDVTEKEVADFGRWLREGPANVQEYLEVLAMWEQLGLIDASRRIEIDELLPESNVTGLHDEFDVIGEDPPIGRTPRNRIPAIAASMLLAVGLAAGTAWYFISSPGTEYTAYVTELGEHRSVSLQDGSVMHLNARSRARATIDEESRRVYLESGEAYFEVFEDTSRPFIVDVDDVEIRVVGTRFNVRRYGRVATVTVIDGSVSVEKRDRARGGPQFSRPVGGERPSQHDAPIDGRRSVELSRGQQVRIEPRAGLVVRPVELRNVLAWRDRRFVFEDTRLDDILAEFNRYNERQIVVADSAIGDIRLTGVFLANDPQSLLDFLERSHGIAIMRTKDGSNAVVLTE